MRSRSEGRTGRRRTRSPLRKVSSALWRAPKSGEGSTWLTGAPPCSRRQSVVVELRVATFNIQHGLSAGGEVDVALLARTCRRLDVDVLAIQEVDRHLERTDRLDIAAAVAEECAMSCAFGPAIAIRGGEYGNALLVRGEIGAVDVVGVETPETGCSDHRPLVATVVTSGA